MKTADMLLQTEYVGRCLDERNVIFVGDGDAIGLCLVHLKRQGVLDRGPKSVHIIDFDERVVLSIREFAKRFGVKTRVTAELYNVADALPKKHWQKFDAFYTNPPFGQRNDGRSIEAFLLRGIEATRPGGVGCVVLADDRNYPWTHDVLLKTERFVQEKGFVISEILPEFHAYHLDDAPDLRSCSMLVNALELKRASYKSTRLPNAMLENFYGQEAPLIVRYVRDLTLGGKLPSKDHHLQPF